jgi:hypothetical protein
MNSLQRHIATITNISDNLITELRELDRLRDEIRKVVLQSKGAPRPIRRTRSSKTPDVVLEAADRDEAAAAARFAAWPALADGRSAVG